MFRIGQGYDVHKLVEDRELWICGIKLPHTHGLLGHSDADVAIHALCDALLGALALRDIGYHFPDTDPKYKGADSKLLLKEVCRMIRERGWEIGNVDVTIMAEAPKFKPHIDEMRQCLADVMNVAVDAVSVKATTTEKLGFTGRKEGIASTAVALIYEP
ncbi:2-C-methyl-D-erythritol 2,4-cyclodiphosphate synthase [Muribaculaceae bacterium Isolate-037 (Harlan)]|jgi:2-C-methyl-D-erythritol 2,4-cyclodiphosphate synthase|uniref:2-C-methyl-D-erythritol 2,4-cyclodiphosphate synthase n=2 Tax=Lepagella muris TaxID=3032870 RepID=A0AC61RBN5_9BACT|nr:2-C-methyl-D-erythritol 2,4-cyclodiphosphate synthase [Muribaculaceae bacterium Isolate-037 (Harlan)]TGY77571.1 2-C-methyl-D-erythritol 2,4-cyclodiphosphate synthase [Lepagella muris]THG50062.1 2-C-methyl-D-erythritol 2,4-cyclodiphosphate synthase [Bacteroidales bacterium]TKC63212.1 2-C-methyl-D-erythritol 2,4-cyclodiphosphate synthase [Bacteroidales bacterium]